jgi:glyoxylase-like metal-dependent hydrolase (beta-lactamase superfamily II)
VVSVIDALHRQSLDERDVLAVVNTHLHFDHCGQNSLLGHAPVWVTAAEVEAASVEFYTVPEWAEISERRLRLSADGEEIAPDVRVLHTPGHTPGHQSVTVLTDRGLEVIVGQACFSCGEYASERPEPTDMHDAEWIPVGVESLTRLRGLGAVRAHFSHDRDVFDESQ